jgi:DNA-binding beta-propeller fold protein YncE
MRWVVVTSRSRRLGVCALAACAVAAGCSKSGSTPLPSPDIWMYDLSQNSSCILNCDPSCAEAGKPWVCPALDSWGNLPHADACKPFDGTTVPAPQQGACNATDPSGDAVEKTNPSGSPVVLPDGRRIEPAGNEWVLNDFPGGFPSNALQVPGTRWLVVVDTGYETHSVRVVDTGLLRAGGMTTPVVSSVRFDPPKALNWGMAYVATPSVVYVSSGYQSTTDPNPQVFAFDLDTKSGALTEDAAKTIALPMGVFPQAVAVSGDGKTMLVGQVTDSHVLAVSLDSATYGKVTANIDLGGQDDVYELRFDPNDPANDAAYATLWEANPDISMPTSMRVAQITVSGKKASLLPVGKAPEGMLFLDARTMLVAEALSDSIAVIDRPSGKVVAEAALGGAAFEPTSLAWDAQNKRVYATLASANAVEAFDVDTTKTPPTLTPAGRISTGWWPTSVTVDPADGTLYVTNGRGHGAVGLNTDGDNGTYLHGSVQAIPYVGSGALATATTQHDADENVGAFTGYPAVQCAGAPYDFPVPAKPEDGPSTLIQHIVFVVRENKTFDALFGDMPGVDGNPQYILSPMHQSQIWQNARKIATGFSHMDNFYEDAEQSIQGHFWTVYGRTSDFDERRWVVTWGRSEFSATSSPGVADNTAPLEGSLFSWLQAQNVTLDNMGELVGGVPYRDTNWPGGSTDATIPDTLGGCYVAGRARVLCDLPQFNYVWLTNDHTFGLAAGKPNPALMMSVNDEATGMLLDGISHSPIWPSTLVIVVEDDPSTGQDHVDQHRTIALFASPWIKRGYVSHAHYDVASLHKLFSHLLGKPYRNRVIANAALPLDVFTSTPDYTPFEYVPRTFGDGSCNADGTSGAMRARVWDFSHPDEQPGLDEQLEETLRTLP